MKPYREYRYPCDLGVMLRGAGGERPAVLTNISPGGARLAGVQGVAVGDLVQIGFRSGAAPLPAIVRWVRAGAAGLRFERRLTAEGLQRIRGRATGASAAGWPQVQAGLQVMR